MPKQLSDQLADLSVKAKRVEDSISSASKETHDQVVARREQARASASAAIDRVEQDIRNAGDQVTERWNAMKSKVSADMERLKTKHAERQHERNVERAQQRAARLEAEAEVAIDYALASIEDARLAALDAIIAGIESEETRRT